ncbi:MAG TPA: efflux RND transporter periplasmic adaptor subunit [Thermoanaerobaculia bacterium]|nr:efflux RND transporter periplasmic adaptor subunit [Thermoanaerobaculia bacterium]
MSSKPYLKNIGLSLGLAILAVLSYACGGREKEAAAPPPPVVLGPADTAVVVMAPIETGPALTGTLAAEEEATVRAQLGGTVLETYAEPGQAVRRGAALARLDTAALRDAMASAQAAVTNARNSLAVAEREAERQRVLVQAGAVAERNVETAHQQVVAARAALSLAQAQLANAEEQVANTRITAPFSGVVSDKQVSAGDVVQPGAALFTIVNPSILELEATVPAERLSALRAGAPVQFNVNGYPGRRFTGEITRINPSADPVTRQVRVYAQIANPDGELVAGLFAEGRVATESRTALTVPRDAVDRRMAQRALLVVRQNRVGRVDVELGLEDEQEQRVEIRRGAVQAGDVVLLGAAQGITPGTQVQLAPTVQERADRLAQAL